MSDDVHVYGVSDEFADDMLHLLTDAYYELRGLCHRFNDDPVWREYARSVSRWLDEAERLFPDLLH